MDLYTFSLALGSAGLGAMAVAGLGQHVAASHGAPHGGLHGARHPGAPQIGHHHAGPHHAGHSAAAHGHHATQGGHRGAADAAAHAHHGDNLYQVHNHGGAAVSRAVWSLVSPRVLFSLLVGFGATGLLLRPLAGGALLFAAAVAGGALFEWLLVAPLWRSLLRFASAPALTLESCIADEVRAVSGFDAQGNGLVAAELDGQMVQLLGTLRPEDRAAGVRVRAGDRLRVEDVDAARNRCTVSYLGR